MFVRASVKLWELHYEALLCLGFRRDEVAWITTVALYDY